MGTALLGGLTGQLGLPAAVVLLAGGGLVATQLRGLALLRDKWTAVMDQAIAEVDVWIREERESDADEEGAEPG